jgi:signal transduction histidine kinase
MLSGVVHDLKTPMTIISGFAQLMVQSDEREVRDQYAEQILKQFGVMSAMTREVLAFARGESNLLIRKVYLHRFIRDITQHLEHEFTNKGIELRVEQRYQGVAFMDEPKMRRVFHNIARNAAEAMPDGGTFEIAVDGGRDGVVFTFRDTGGGIPAELEGRMFELFATAGKKEGTGLGLALVRKIINDHNGEIAYETGDSGTTFSISLPMRRAESPTGDWPLVAES